MMALVLTIAAQGQTEIVDTTQFVAVYDYECRTQNDEAASVTDRMQVVVQVGRTVTKSMPFSAYPQTDEISRADSPKCVLVCRGADWTISNSNDKISM